MAGIKISKGLDTLMIIESTMNFKLTRTVQINSKYLNSTPVNQMCRWLKLAIVTIPTVKSNNNWLDKIEV